MNTAEQNAIAKIKPSSVPGRDLPGWNDGKGFVAMKAPDSVIACTYEDLFGFKPAATHTRQDMIDAITLINRALQS